MSKQITYNLKTPKTKQNKFKIRSRTNSFVRSNDQLDEQFEPCSHNKQTSQLILDV